MPTLFQLTVETCQLLPSRTGFSPYQFLAAGDAHPAPETVH